MPFTTRPQLIGTVGMVASTHWLASAAGMAMLERGGTAADAAAAAGFVLQVVQPNLNGPNGDMPALCYDAATDRTDVLCGQGVAPATADLGSYLDLGLDAVPGSGLLAACVPGAFGGWLALLERSGRLPLRDVLEPAIHYARQGFPLSAGAAQAIDTVASLFGEHWPESAQVWLPGGRVPQAGEQFRNPLLADTLQRVLTEAEAAGTGRAAQLEGARRAWYEGFVAQAIDDFLVEREAFDVTGECQRGLLRGADLSNWRAGFEPALTAAYGDWQVSKTGPWGQGPVFLAQLAILQNTDVAELDPLGAPFVHLVTESAKLALLDRNAWLGDDELARTVVDTLIDPQYGKQRSQLIERTASMQLRPGNPLALVPRLPLPGSAPSGGGWPGLGDPTLRQRGAFRGETCQVDVVDRWGNMIAATPSGGWLQSSPAIPGLGCALSSSAQLFTLDPGLPNTIGPGKRPRSTLSPTMALHRDGTRLGFGSPGGDLQDQWSLTFFLRVAHTDWPLAQVMDAPMFHTLHAPGSFYPHISLPGSLAIEESAGEPVLDELRERGHQVRARPAWSLGRMCAVGSTPDGRLLAAANPREMQAYAVGR